MVGNPKTMTKRNPYRFQKALIMGPGVKQIQTKMFFYMKNIKNYLLQITTNIFQDTITSIFKLDTLFGFSGHKIPVTTTHYSFLDM